MKRSRTISLFCLMFFFFPLTAFSQQAASVAGISEIMFYGVSGNNEYVEIFNSSFINDIDLTNYSIKYYTSKADTIISAGMGLTLKARSYAVIFEGDYDFPSGVYKNSIPKEALVLRIKSSAFGTSGMSNTTGRTVSLLDSKSDTVDQYTYSTDNKAGISDEKIYLDRPNSSSNWTNSLLQGGTPGFRNSASPMDFDISLLSIKILPENPKQDETISVSLTLRNFGLRAAENFSVEAFLDVNRDSVQNSSERVYSGNVSRLASRDSAAVTFMMPGLAPGSYQLIGVINFAEDEAAVNNKRVLSFRVNPAAGKYNDLIINEIMFAPSSGEPEWIELFNTSGSTLNLKNWEIFDRVSHAGITQKDAYVKAGSYIVLSRDPVIRNYYDIPSEVLTCSLPSLNNTGDRIIIRDSTGQIIDSLDYSAPYGSGRSLERIDPKGPSNEASNWKLSISPFKATPGKINSAAKRDYNLALTGVSSNPVKAFAGSRITILAKVKNTGRNAAGFYLQLYGDTNSDSLPEEKLSQSGMLFLNPGDSLIYEFEYSEILHNERSFIAGIISEKDEDPSDNIFLKKILPLYSYNALVINEIMYVPETPEPEWIEIYNTSPDSVNIKNWSVSDILSSPAKVTLGAKDEYIQSGSFIVISRDSLIHRAHRHIPSKVIYINLPALNNDTDGVVLKDALGTLIDSVTYGPPASGIKAGYSIERRHTTEPSASDSNWAFSKSPERSTPGGVNSITPKEYDLSIEEISTLPKTPLAGENISLRIKILNPGLKDAENFSVKVFYRDYNSSVYNSLGTEEGLSLKTSDTLIINFENCLSVLKSGICAAAVIVYALDKDTTNNFLQKLIEPGYRRNALLINEVMFAPPAGESEWLELVNVSNDTLNLKDWQIGELLPSPSKAKLTSESVLIYPGEFIIAASDSSFLKSHGRINSRVFITPFGSLNNTGDIIVLYDLKGKVIDSLMFRGSWLDRKNSSIERVSFEKETSDSSNWVVCTGKEGSTAGSPNWAACLRSYTRNSVVINEVMYEPGKENSEFIEIYNAGSEEIDLSNWKIKNESGSSFYVTDENFILPKGGYFIIASDSMIFNNYRWVKDSCKYSVKDMHSLSNTGGLIHLKDALRNTIDSVYYSGLWHSKSVPETLNRSLERINPLLSSNDASNWKTSVGKEGATPGRLNSIFVLNQKSGSRFSVLPNPFSPDDDGFEDFTIINYNLAEGVASVSLKVFDSQGRLVRTIASMGGYGSRGSLVFDGMSDSGVPLRMGIYILLLQASDSSNIVMETIKSVVVVARKL